MLDKRSRKIKERLSDKFDIYGLTLNFKEILTLLEGAQKEFLDVLHTINKDEIKGFKTTDYVKPTATFRKFHNEKSYHRPSFFEEYS